MGLSFRFELMPVQRRFEQRKLEGEERARTGTRAHVCVGGCVLVWVWVCVCVGGGGGGGT